MYTHTHTQKKGLLGFLAFIDLKVTFTLAFPVSS